MKIAKDVGYGNGCHMMMTSWTKKKQDGYCEEGICFKSWEWVEESKMKYQDKDENQRSQNVRRQRESRL